LSPEVKARCPGKQICPGRRVKRRGCLFGVKSVHVIQACNVQIIGIAGQRQRFVQQDMYADPLQRCDHRRSIVIAEYA